MKSLTGPIIKSLIFIVVTVFATAMLALTITNGNLGSGHQFNAVFADVTSLNSGDDVRMAGVRIGQVTSIEIVHKREARVGFSVQSDVRLAKTVTATIRFRNLIGQRYISLDEGAAPLDHPLHSGSTIPLTRTSPALDLTVLFNGFQPLFQALSPGEINELSGEIIAVFQGEGPTIDNLLAQTASLTNTLADKDQIIGEVIDNLNSVLDVVNGRGDQLTTLIKTLQTFVSGLAQDRRPLGDAISGIAALTNDVGDLIGQARAPLKTSISSLRTLSENLAGSSGALNSFLQQLPGKLNQLGRVASYGSWLNFYVCSISGRIPVPGGYGDVPRDPKRLNIPTGPPDPSGLVGIDSPAARCQA
jgi:phospholipid/cholesterol/gamma-HCH transport system substrate-binding protein